MRKVLISAILAASTLAIAAPAAAQNYQPQYGAPYGNAYGYNNNRGQVRVLQVRLNQIERQINQLDSRNILSDREADRLRREANVLEQQIRQLGRNGLNSYERRNIEVRLVRLEQNVRRQATDGNRWGNRSTVYGNAYDRDRDGRDDRYEDDRGYRHD